MSDTEAQKKQKEREWIEGVIESAPFLEWHSVENSICPDFVLYRNGERVGVEITTLAAPKTSSRDPSELDGLIDLMRRALAKALNEQQIPPIWVTLFLNRAFKHSRENRAALAAGIADFLNSQIPCVHGSRDWRPAPMHLRQLGATAIQVRRPQTLKQTQCTIPRMGVLQQLDLKIVTKAIRAKEEHIPSYRKNCDKLALILVVDSRGIATIFDPDFDAQDLTTETKFDEVLIYSPLRRRLIRLK